MVECVMDVKKFDYTDLIDFDCKNQTAKLLENACTIDGE